MWSQLSYIYCLRGRCLSYSMVSILCIAQWKFIEHFAVICEFWSESETSTMTNYTGDLARYVLDRLFDNLTDKSYWNVDDWNNVDLLRIITRGSNSKCQLTIGVFSIAFAMSVIEKVVEFLNTLTMQYELRYEWWINAVVMILSVPHCLCWLFYFHNIITFLFEKLTCAVEILIWCDTVDFLTKSLGMPYSWVTAQQACSTEMVNDHIVTCCCRLTQRSSNGQRSGERPAELGHRRRPPLRHAVSVPPRLSEFPHSLARHPPTHPLARHPPGLHHRPAQRGSVPTADHSGRSVPADVPGN